MKSFFALNALFLITLFSCNQPSSHRTPELQAGCEVLLKYAEGFSIKVDSSYIWIEVKHPYQGSDQGFRYLLVPHEVPIPDHAAEVKVIRIPVSSIACTSTTHIPLLDYLDETESLSGFTTMDYISSARARKRIEEGKVVELGVDKGINIEILSALKPDLLMGYTMTAEYGQFKKIEELGIPVVINAEYLETHPLGRAEWIKFMAAFFNKLDKADSVFAAIEERYLAVRKIARSIEVKPTVLSGILYGDAWFLPGGKNYAATLLKDAGYQYLWADDPSNGFLELSFESVFSRAHECDYWIGVGPFQSLDEMRATDHRYGQFRALKNKNVFSYDARKGEKGGNEYLELGYLRPDLILQDLVKISSPELLPSHNLYFHRRLN
jgi:iron complex transport system substrate-binding protein